MRTLALATLAALAASLCAAPEAEAFRPTKQPVSPAGVRAQVDVPPELHMRNTGGMGRRGPGTGAGLCVFTSIEVAGRWQGVKEVEGFQKWMTVRPGGGSPRKLEAMLSQFCRERGVPVPAYVQHTGGDVRFLELALRTRRMVAVTYAGNDDHYAGGIDHMVNLVHLDQSSAAIVDNNRPGTFVWMTRSEFIQRWKARGGGWAVVLLESPPPPPAPPEVKADVGEKPAKSPRPCDAHGRDCPAEPHEFTLIESHPIPFTDFAVVTYRPATRAEALAKWRGVGYVAVTVPTHQYQQCPNGRCPVPVAPAFPAAPAARPSAPRPPPPAPKVDRSASSVYVERDSGRWNARHKSWEFDCGTGTVVASGKGKSLIVTNAHVVPDGRRPVAIYAGGKKYPARHLASSELRPDRPDLCALVVDAELPVAEVAAEPAPAGTAVYQWGYGAGGVERKAVLKSGYVSPAGTYVGPKTMRTSIPSQNGDSGSGVFNSAGELVGVCWGGESAPEDDRQYANKLDATRAFLKEHASGEFPGLFGARQAEKAPAPHQVQNFGVDRDELEKLTEGGAQRYWVGGAEATREGAFDAIRSAGGLVDDSDKWFLSVVGGDAERKKLEAMLADPRLAKYRDRFHVRLWPRDSWVARDRLRAAVTLQQPGGAVVGTLDAFDVELILRLLQLAFDPPPKPMPPPAPAPQPAPAPPPGSPPVDKPLPDQQPDPTPAPTPAQLQPWQFFAILLLALWLYLRPRQPPKEK